VHTKDDLVAQVEVNGEFVGKTPYIGKLYFDEKGERLDKEYKVIVKKEGYADSEPQLFIYKILMKKEKSEINFTLRKKEGFIEIKSPVGFKVKVNGRLLRDKNGRTELTPLRFKRIPGIYTVLLYSSKRDNKIKIYKKIVRVLTVKDKETVLFPQLKAEKSEKYLLAKKREEKRKVAKKREKNSLKESKKALKLPIKPSMSRSYQGIHVSKKEVTYNELVRFLNHENLSDDELKGYFYIRSNSVSKYIYKEKIKGRIEYFVYKGYENYPVIQISWAGTKAYIRWLNQTFGASYRLPTADEWEMVAGLKFDSNNIDNIAHHSQNSTFSETGLKKENVLGIFDLFGNVSEWTEDKFGEFSRVIVGGSYQTSKIYLNPSMRNGVNEHNKKSLDVGFRIVE
jgi:hypothetical protein